MSLETGLVEYILLICICIFATTTWSCWHIINSLLSEDKCMLLHSSENTTIDKIETKNNVRKRNILLKNRDLQCLFSQIEAEKTLHLMFSCRFSSFIWKHFYGRLGVQSMQHMVPKSHFLLHTCGFSENRINMAQRLVCSVDVWTLLLHKNCIVFKK